MTAFDIDGEPMRIMYWDRHAVLVVDSTKAQAHCSEMAAIEGIETRLFINNKVLSIPQNWQMQCD